MPIFAALPDISERWLPYDVVHLLNAYFDRVARQIEMNGGEIDKFMGDGVMALFSSKRKIAKSARQSLVAALHVLETVDAMNEENAAEWEKPLRVAIGIHGGPAILGQIGGGARANRARTALGRTINSASRLQDFAKTQEAALAVSADIAALAGLSLIGGERFVTELRGSHQPLEVIVYADTAALRHALAQTGAVEDSPPALTTG